MPRRMFPFHTAWSERAFDKVTSGQRNARNEETSPMDTWGERESQADGNIKHKGRGGSSVLG